MAGRKLFSKMVQSEKTFVTDCKHGKPGRKFLAPNLHRNRSALHISFSLGRTSRSPKFIKRRVIVASLICADAQGPSAQDLLLIQPRTSAAIESLRLLGWHELCFQVACMCSTPMAASLALNAEVPIGSSQEASEILLQQTEEALQLELSFENIFDISNAAIAAAEGRVLNPLQLDAVALTLQAATHMESCICCHGDNGDRVSDQAAQGAGQWPALQSLIGGRLYGGLPHLAERIHHAIKAGEGRVLDDASARLSDIRQQQGSTQHELKSLMDAWCRKLHAANAAERPLVVVRRERLCVPVKAGRQSELPSGSATLDVSSTGRTLYMEPAPAVPLNNRMALLSGQATEEEQRILMELSHMVGRHVHEMLSIMDAIADVDLAKARARHAVWVNGVRPKFHPHDPLGPDTPPVHIPSARHPLLLEPSLPPLTPPTNAEDVTFENSYMGPVVAGSVRDIGGELPRRRDPIAPVPTDLTVPAGVKVVAVTGPNTGGKTASLKTLGLLAIMAKAGMFVPIFREDGDVDVQPSLMWFDKVLADIGDGQSLQQSLSTFSGHIRRISRILDEATHKSLVLLDEVGSGTDPVEGSALASSILSTLSHSAALTYATTHHAELKTMAEVTPLCINASVEFDAVSLRPTYRLLWGKAGDSNALLVAQGLRFDGAVVNEARKVMQQGFLSLNPNQQSAALVESVKQQLEEARIQCKEVAQIRHDQQQEYDRVHHQLQELRSKQHQVQQQQDELNSFSSTVTSSFDQVLIQLESGQITADEALREIREVELAASGAVDSLPALLGLQSTQVAVQDRRGSSGEASSSGSGASRWLPQVGEKVIVLRMGGVVGEVVSSSGKASGRVSVLVGRNKYQVRVSDVAPCGDDVIMDSSGKRSASLTSNDTGGQLGSAPRGVHFDSSQRSRSGGTGVAKTRQHSSARNTRKGGQQSDVSRSADQGGSDDALAIQTSGNTVDLRGCRVDDALTELNLALGSGGVGAVLFVVHGVGTGRLKERVHECLQRSRMVKRFELEKKSYGGCTIVYLR